jgi:hypothetical protein
MAGHAHVDHSGDKRIALLIAILALFLAVVETGAKSAQTEALARNVEAANLWSFFQARTIRQTTLRTAAEEAELAKGAATGELKAAIEAQQKRWRDSVARWESEPDTGEGRKELSERARKAEAVRDRSMAAYHLFEYAAAAFQVAIVVASASIITGVPLLAMGGMALGVAGAVLGAFGWLAPTVLHF